MLIKTILVLQLVLFSVVRSLVIPIFALFEVVFLSFNFPFFNLCFF